MLNFFAASVLQFSGLLAQTRDRTRAARALKRGGQSPTAQLLGDTETIPLDSQMAALASQTSPLLDEMIGARFVVS